MIKYLISILALIISAPILNAQLTVNEEPGVSKMMNDFVTKNRSNTTVKAWRIQIITTNDRRKMEQVLSKFNNMFPEMETFWTHENPYYKVKVGAFESKEELQPFLLEVKREFFSAIPVVDSIEKKELVK